MPSTKGRRKRIAWRWKTESAEARPFVDLLLANFADSCNIVERRSLAALELNILSP